MSWVYAKNSNTWKNLDSGTVIMEEDMPWELKPDYKISVEFLRDSTPGFVQINWYIESTSSTFNDIDQLGLSLRGPRPECSYVEDES